MKPYKRRVDSQAYISSGSQSFIRLPRNYNYRSLFCRISGSVIVTGGTGAGAPHTLAAYKAISRLEIVVDGRDTILSCDPAALAIMNAIDYGTFPNFSNPSNDTAATYSFNGSFIIDFQMKRGKFATDTLFPATGLTSFDLVVTWGAGSDMFTGSVDFTSAVIQTTTTLSVTSFEEIGDPTKVVGGLKKVFKQAKDIPATTSNFQVDLPQGNLIPQILLYTTLSTNVESAAILNKVSYQSGTEVYQKWEDDNEMIDYAKLAYSLESTSTTWVGWYILDHMDSDGLMSEVLDTLGVSGLQLVADVTKGSGVNTLTTYPTEIIVPRKKA